MLTQDPAAAAVAFVRQLEVRLFKLRVREIAGREERMSGNESYERLEV